MFTKDQFITLCNLQEALQIKAVGPDWKEKNLDFGAAIYTEAAEAMGHYGWEWWKQQSPNFVQAAIELVDILHFANCGIIQSTSPELAYEMLQNSIDHIDPDELKALNELSFVDHCKTIGLLGSQGYYSQVIYHATIAVKLLGFDSNYLFYAYLGKNVLNSFRKANGYKEGTYIKMWFGKEDNVHLEYILNSFIVTNTVPTPEQIEADLAIIYKQVLMDNETKPTPIKHIQH